MFYALQLPVITVISSRFFNCILLFLYLCGCPKQLWIYSIAIKNVIQFFCFEQFTKYYCLYSKSDDGNGVMINIMFFLVTITYSIIFFNRSTNNVFFSMFIGKRTCLNCVAFQFVDVLLLISHAWFSIFKFIDYNAIISKLWHNCYTPLREMDDRSCGLFVLCVSIGTILSLSYLTSTFTCLFT